MGEKKTLKEEKTFGTRVKRMIFVVFRIVLIVYISLCVILFFLQKKLIYMPSKDTSVKPSRWGFTPEEVTFQTADGVELWAWFIPVKKPRGTILFCHGNAGNLTHRGDSIKVFLKMGYQVLIFDYRGYGKSQGSPSEEGTYRDGDAAWKYLTETKKIPPSKIVIFGRSLGGGIASYLAEKHKVRGLILESTFTSATDLGAELYPIFPVRLLSRIHYPTKKRIPKIDCPKLFIHSPQDDIIPYSHGQRLFELAREPKTFLKIKGGHNEGFWLSGKIYSEGLEKFLKTLKKK